MGIRGVAIFVLMLGLVGCAHRPQATTRPANTFARIGLNELTKVEPIHALCAPPVGWLPEPLKSSGNHTHQVWLSPSGNTAYGVIRFSLPFPVGPDLVLPFFLSEMRESEGSATLVEKHHDEKVGGLRFVAEGGMYTVRSIMVTRGWQGWSVYAGTVRDEPINRTELDLAEMAREHTQVDVD